MAWPTALQQTIGRDQGPQLWSSQSWTPGTVAVTLQQQQMADLSRPSEGVLIIIRYRATIGVAAYTSLNAEAPQNILQTARIYGNNSRAGQMAPFNGSGASLYALGSMFDTSGTGAASVQYITSSVAAVQNRQPRLSSPMGLTVGTAAGQFGGVASYDVETHYYLPFGPFGASAAFRTLFSQRDADWNRTMAFTLTLGTNPTTGAADAFGVKAGTTTLAFTGYGGVGNPQVNVYLIPTLQASATGAVVAAYVPGVIQRNVSSPATAPTSNGNQQLLQLLQNYDTSAITIKSGVVTAAGDYSSLSDNIFTKYYLTVGGKPLIQLNDQFSFKAFSEYKCQGLFPQGYTAWSSVAGGDKFNWKSIFKAPVAGTQFNLYADVVGAANQQAEIWQEQILIQPAVIGGNAS